RVGQPTGGPPGRRSPGGRRSREEHRAREAPRAREAGGDDRQDPSRQARPVLQGPEHWRPARAVLLQGSGRQADRAGRDQRGDRRHRREHPGATVRPVRPGRGPDEGDEGLRSRSLRGGGQGVNVSSLSKKLLLKSWDRLLLIDPPEGHRRLFSDIELVDRPGEVPNVLLYVQDKAQLAERLPAAANRLLAEARLWVAYPKAKKMGTDLNRDSLWKL